MHQTIAATTAQLGDRLMDPSLEEKAAFFKQLETVRDIDDAEDIASAERDVGRQTCRAFNTAVPNKKASRHPLRRTISELPASANGDANQTIKNIAKLNQGRASTTIAGSPSIEKSPAAPDPVRATNPLSRRTTHPQPQVRAAQSPSFDTSSSVTMSSKRKRVASLTMVPEAQQCFKGLCFYYIPNDDINPVRKKRITRAREHGATWVRELAEATHIIVDSNLKYDDIEKIVSGLSGHSRKVIVNESYPLHCISYKMLVNPDQSQYRVPGFPESSNLVATAAAPRPSSSSGNSSHPSKESLKLKPQHNNPKRWDYVPPEGTPPRSGDSSQPSAELLACHQPIPSSQPEGGVGVDFRTAGGQQATSQPPNSAETNVPTSAPDDELSKCIGQVLEGEDLPTGLDNDEETPTSTDADQSSEEGSDGRRRRKKWRWSSTAKNDPNWQDKFACMAGGTKGAKWDNPNAETIAKLQEMCDIYSRTGEHWRTLSYRRTIAALKQQKKQITSYEAAMAIDNIGESIARKIEEFTNTGQVKKLDHLQKDSQLEVLDAFMKIYGVGLEQASRWYARGLRTLDDLREKANLTSNQQIGLEHYDDLNTRIPRREVEALGRCVKRAAAAVDADVQLIIGGSYRRGSESSGDIDFIITKQGTNSSDALTPFLDSLVSKLTKEGFLICALASHHSKGGGSKWHGCCVLPASEFPGDPANYRPIWRRIDFLLVPDSEFGAALIYFTGDDVFNRSIRLLASKKGMRLNQRGLYEDVLRGPRRVKFTEGTLLEGREERKIFELLGVQWREPSERWCG